LPNSYHTSYDSYDSIYHTVTTPQLYDNKLVETWRVRSRRSSMLPSRERHNTPSTHRRRSTVPPVDATHTVDTVASTQYLPWNSTYTIDTHTP